MNPATTKPEFTGPPASTPAIRKPQHLRNHEHIRQCAQEIYRARGGLRGMRLNDWLKAEQQLKQELKKQITNQ
jgi:hypothetical protein